MDQIQRNWKVKDITLPERRLLNPDKTALHLKIEELRVGFSTSFIFL
jgi:hypothetical protein